MNEERGHVVKKCFVLVRAAVVLVLAMPAPGRSQVLIPGNPPLTEEMIGRFAEFFEWAFDVRLTNDQCNVLRKYSVDIWKKQTKSQMEEIQNVVQLQIELSKADPKQLAVVRANYEPQVLDAMRKQPNEPMAVWALAVYESSHKVLAPGNPPLTRQVSDAFLEALFFMLGEVQGKTDEVPDAQLKNDWAAGLAGSYARMPDAMKKQIAGMPLFVAQMRLNWPAMPESEKAKYRAVWAEAVKTLLPAAAPAASNSQTGGKMSIADAMAEQNRRFQMHMNTSTAMMDIYKISYNTQANFSGNPYRYW
jgi:hypothetical protein